MLKCAFERNKATDIGEILFELSKYVYSETLISLTFQTLLIGTNPNTYSQLTRTTICSAFWKTLPVAAVGLQAPTAKRILQLSSPKKSPSTGSRCYSRKTSETRSSARATVKYGLTAFNPPFNILQVKDFKIRFEDLRILLLRTDLRTAEDAILYLFTINLSVLFLPNKD